MRLSTTAAHFVHFSSVKLIERKRNTAQIFVTLQQYSLRLKWEANHRLDNKQPIGSQVCSNQYFTLSAVELQVCFGSILEPNNIEDR